MQYDLVGIGAGPFSLSLAALLEPTSLRTRFLERQKFYQWHPGMLLPGAKLQNSFLRDLVTGVDPTNRHSFLNFLVKKGRFYRFLHADQTSVSRQEFSQYLSWAAERMDHVSHNSDVQWVEFQAGKGFEITLGNGEQVISQHLNLGTGKRPYTPSCATSFLGERCFHASELGLRKLNVNHQRVAIVGGGQTGAEVFLQLLSKNYGIPTSVQWHSRRANLEPLDETPFTNDYFSPSYMDAFVSLPRSKKKTLLADQKRASDGISPATLSELYQTLYSREVNNDTSLAVSLRPNREIKSMSMKGAEYLLTIFNSLSQQWEYEPADIVICCTGYRYGLPDCLAPIAERLHCDAHYGLALNSKYRVQWDGPEEHGIYAVNAGILSHGIVDPQMSLNAWRAATIVNDILKQDFYCLSHHSYLNWLTTPGSNTSLSKITAA